MVLLEPVSVSLGDIFMDAMRWEFVDGLLLCDDNKILDVKEIKAPSPCNSQAVFPGVSISYLERFIHGQTLAGTWFPVTPFFTSSFAMSILYYLVVVVFISGMAVLRVIRKVFVFESLNIVERPFTILSLASLPILMIIGNIARVLSSV
jgi:hypothetical protein